MGHENCVVPICLALTCLFEFSRRGNLRAQSKARGEKLNDSLLYAQFNRDVAEVREQSENTCFFSWLLITLRIFFQKYQICNKKLDIMF